MLSGPSYACEPYYHFDFEKLPQAEAAVKKLEVNRENPLELLFKNNFQDCVLGAQRLAPSPENQQKMIFKQIKNMAFSFRRQGIELPLSKVSDNKAIQVITLQHIAENYNETEALNLSQQFNHAFPLSINNLSLNYEKAYGRYLQYIDFFGPWRTWKFQEILMPLFFSLENSDFGDWIFKTLKDTRFIVSPYGTLSHVPYDPRVVVTHLLQQRQFDTLILGCGHHFPAALADTLNVRPEAFCGACDSDDYHKDALTIDRLASANTDVIADMHDPILWTTLIIQKPEGWRQIEDHSWSESLQNLQTLKNIYSALTKDGIFAVWDKIPTSNQSIWKNIENAGFVLGGVDEMKNLTFFVKA